MIQEFLSTYGMEIVGLILTSLFGFVGIAIRKIAKTWLDTQEKQEVARIAVRFVEQVFKELHGEAKLVEALRIASGLLSRKNINIDVDEMRVLLESAVEEMNEQIKPKE